MLGVDDCAYATLLLGLGYDVDSQSGLTRRLRTIYLGDTSARQTADTQSQVETERPGGNRLDILHRAVAETHHRARAEILLQMGHRHAESLQFLIFIRYADARSRSRFLFYCHNK